jgi:hypothetical protein
MTKRLFWLTTGFLAGVVLTVRTNKVVRRTVDRYLPEPMARRLREFDAAVEERRILIQARKRGLS